MFVEKLEHLINERNTNKHKLSIETGIPYTTIKSWSDRNEDGIKFSYLVILSDYFGVTVDYLVRDEIPPLEIVKLNDTEEELITKYRNTSAANQYTINKFIEFITQN